MTLEYARWLRRKSGVVERIIWMNLRNRSLKGYKFRRQHQLGPYIVDFICIEKRLIVEMDGPHHQDQKPYDEKRDRWLQSQGFRVMRIKNEEFLMKDQVVWERIVGELEKG